jgi:hypothetical protein
MISFRVSPFLSPLQFSLKLHVSILESVAEAVNQDDVLTDRQV